MTGEPETINMTGPLGETLFRRALSYCLTEEVPKYIQDQVKRAFSMADS